MDPSMDGESLPEERQLSAGIQASPVASTSAEDIDIVYELFCSGVQYSSALEACIQMLDDQITAKEIKHENLQTALHRPDTLPVSAMLRCPYIRDRKGEGAPAMTAEHQLEIVPDVEDLAREKAIWKPSDDQLLLKAVTDVLKRKKIAERNIQRIKHEKRIRELKIELEEKIVEDEGSEEIRKEIAEEEVLLEEVREQLNALDEENFDRKMLAGIELRDYDWHDIGKQASLQRHGENACQLRWTNLINPDIRDGKWPKTAQNRLKSVVESVGEHSWEEVASHFPGRSAFSCCCQYRKMQVNEAKKEQEAKERNEMFSVEEIVTLIHAYYVCDGIWPLVEKFLPNRREQCKRYWSRYLDSDKRTDKWTEKELNVMKNFAETSKVRGLKVLYRKLPNRDQSLIGKKFRSLYRFDLEQQSWVWSPSDSYHERHTSALRGPLLNRLLRHVFEKVTLQLQENPDVILEDLLQREEVIKPASQWMTEIGLLPHSTVDPVQAAQHALSEADRDLLELFSDDSELKAKATGRPRKTNPFGSIPKDLVISDAGQISQILKEALSSPQNPQNPDGTPGVIIPPNLITLNGILKLRRMVLSADLEEEQNRNGFNAEEFEPIIPAVFSMFLAPEILIEAYKERMKRGSSMGTDENDGEASVENSATKKRKKSGRAKSKSGQLKQRFGWMREKAEKEKLERKEKMMKRKEAMANEEAPTKKRKAEVAAEPVRKSSRINK